MRFRIRFEDGEHPHSNTAQYEGGGKNGFLLPEEMSGLLEGEQSNRHSGNVGDEAPGDGRGHFHAGIFRPAGFGNYPDEHPDQACQTHERKQETRQSAAF